MPGWGWWASWWHLVAGRDILTLLYKPEYADHADLFAWLMVAASGLVYGVAPGIWNDGGAVFPVAVAALRALRELFRPWPVYGSFRDSACMGAVWARLAAPYRPVGRQRCDYCFML